MTYYDLAGYVIAFGFLLVLVGGLCAAEMAQGSLKHYYNQKVFK